MPDPDRSSPGQVIVVGNDTLLIDCGPGTGMKLMKVGISPAAVGRIFLTHLHIDHTLELPSLIFGSCLLGRKERIHLYGPPSTKEFYALLFQKLYPFEASSMREIRKDEFDVQPHEITAGLVCESGNYRVLSASVEHGPPAVAYRIETREGTLVISGDTRPSKALVQLARGASILIHECSFPDDMVETARSTGHATPSEIGRVASEASVEKVILTHISPTWKRREREMVNGVNSRFGGEVVVSNDFLEVNL